MVPANYAITITNIFVSERSPRDYQVSRQENVYMLICQQWALQTCSKDIQCRMSRKDPETIMLTTESIQARSVSAIIKHSSHIISIHGSKLFHSIAKQLGQTKEANAARRTCCVTNRNKTYRFVMSQTRMLLSSELVRISSWRGWNKTHDTLL